MSMTFTKLFSSITESTVWMEAPSTRLVWITMLAMSDRLGRVWASVPGLAHKARVPVEDCRAALNKFLSDDEESRTKDCGGKRIEAIDGGWKLINHGKYRAIRDEEAILESKRKYINDRRKRERVENVEQSRAIAEAEAEAAQIHKEEREVASLPDCFEGKKKSPKPETEIVVPSMLSTSPEFLSSWGVWLDHLKAKRKPATPQAARMQLKKLEAMGVQRAVAALNHSTAGGYQGIYEPHNQSNGSVGGRPNPRNVGICKPAGETVSPYGSEALKRKLAKQALTASQPVQPSDAGGGFAGSGEVLRADVQVAQ